MSTSAPALDRTSRKPNTGGLATADKHDLARQLFVVLSAASLVYAFLAGLRTVADFDLGWLLATGRWIVQHHRIPTTDVFSYTAQGRPWIYPAGSGLFFYAAYLIGKYALLSWLGAVACVATIALLIWKRTPIHAALAVFAASTISLRTTARAEMFTVVLFAAFLALLWSHYENERVRLWCLPILMIAWVNLHLGFVAGLALIAWYAAAEALELIWRDRRAAAAKRLRNAWPWLVATLAATLINPWGPRIYGAILRQSAATSAHAEQITEWIPQQLSWTLLRLSLSARNPDTAIYVLLLVGGIALLVACWQRKLGVVVLLAGAALLAIRHIRFEALFAEVAVIVAGGVLASALSGWWARGKEKRFGSVAAIAVAYLLVALVCVRSADLVSNRSYLGVTNLSTFGTGLSWWFPDTAVDFILREHIPGRIFNTYNEGGFLTWRLGAAYPDYIDGRAIPFGPELFERNLALLRTPPESPAWEREARQYGINAIIVPLGRFYGVDVFPMLRQFCESTAWRPVYLDEISAVFVRRTTGNDSLIERFPVDCARAPLPRVAPQGHTTEAFNRWANAAAVLHALGRNSEAFAASSSALEIFQDSAFIHFLRGNLLQENGQLSDAEQEYLRSAALEVNGATWSRLGTIYRRERRLDDTIQAWKRAAGLLRRPDSELLSLGYAEVEAHHPREALRAFDRARSTRLEFENSDADFLADVAQGKARAWSDMGDVKRAIGFAEDAVRLAPNRVGAWVQLANLYSRDQRAGDADRALEHAPASPVPRPGSTE